MENNDMIPTYMGRQDPGLEPRRKWETPSRGLGAEGLAKLLKGSMSTLQCRISVSHRKGISSDDEGSVQADGLAASALLIG